MNVPRLLLHGAIRRNSGNGLVFYEALRAATKEQLEEALGKLTGRQRYCWSYFDVRAKAIRVRLEELNNG